MPVHTFLNYYQSLSTYICFSSIDLKFPMFIKISKFKFGYANGSGNEFVGNWGKGKYLRHYKLRIKCVQLKSHAHV